MSGKRVSRLDEIGLVLESVQGVVKDSVYVVLDKGLEVRLQIDDAGYDDDDMANVCFEVGLAMEALGFERGGSSGYDFERPGGMWLRPGPVLAGVQ